MKKLLTITALLLLAAANACVSADDGMAQQREKFMQARSALTEARTEQFAKLSRELKNYPLYPYLEYEKLRNNIKTAGKREVGVFLKRYRKQPVGWRLRQAWLQELARREDWRQFLKDYKGNQSDRLRCYKLQAELQTRRSKTFVKDALKLWLVGKSQNDACDPAFEYLQKNGHISRTLLWKRIRLAMKKYQLGLAGHLSRSLPEKDQAWVDLWKAAHHQPSKTLESARLARDNSRARDIIQHALHRIARRDAAQAHSRWKKIKPKYRFSTHQSAQLDKYIAMQATWQKLPEALKWLEEIPELAVNDTIREWRIRTAIRNQDWPSVLANIKKLPATSAETKEWRYWKAMALEKTKRNKAAVDDWYALSTSRDYHGFLAADRLNKSYKTDHQPLDFDIAIVGKLATRDGFVRARELFRANLLIDARREWTSATQKLTSRELKAASALARQWGWHEQAIFTVARARDFSDLHLRFPIDHVETIQHVAGERKLDPGHIFAVIRQESAFGTSAESPAGARGLMQLMPGTGRDTARKYQIPLSGITELYEPKKNILIGSAYLSEVMRKYDENIVLASAAYNAGPHNVKRWLPEKEKISPDNWLATITYRETRTYVQRILAYIPIYDWRMGRPLTPLKKLMHDIYPESHYSRDKK